MVEITLMAIPLLVRFYLFSMNHKELLVRISMSISSERINSQLDIQSTICSSTMFFISLMHNLSLILFCLLIKFTLQALKYV
jgi:hypothetical protein